jgi:hypothetical protein
MFALSQLKNRTPGILFSGWGFAEGGGGGGPIK